MFTLVRKIRWFWSFYPFLSVVLSAFTATETHFKKLFYYKFKTNSSYYSSVRVSPNHKAKWVRLILGGIKGTLIVCFALRNTRWQLNLVSLRQRVLELDGQTKETNDQVNILQTLNTPDGKKRTVCSVNTGDIKEALGKRVS